MGADSKLPGIFGAYRESSSFPWPVLPEGFRLGICRDQLMPGIAGPGAPGVVPRLRGSRSDGIHRVLPGGVLRERGLIAIGVDL